MVTEPGRPQLDLMPTEQVVALLLDAEERVVPAVRPVADQIAAAAEVLAAKLSLGGRLVFVGAGTSGRIAAAEAAELPGTFGLDRQSVLWRIAGGSASTDDDEDDLDAARKDIEHLSLAADDVLIAVAASGSTPYTLEVADAARAAGATVVAVVTVAGSPLAERADLAIAALTEPEVLRESSRLTAGTAQKVILNTLTTAAMVRFGRVHADLMVDVVPANAKLRLRSVAIVAEIAGVANEVAQQAVDECAGNARAAVLHLVVGLPPAQAVARAAAHRSLRDALSQ